MVVFQKVAAKETNINVQHTCIALKLLIECKPAKTDDSTIEQHKKVISALNQLISIDENVVRSAFFRYANYVD